MSVLRVYVYMKRFMRWFHRIHQVPLYAKNTLV